MDIRPSSGLTLLKPALLLFAALFILSCGDDQDPADSTGGGPSAPTALLAEAADSTLIVLSWEPSVTNTVGSYRIRRDGTLLYETTDTFYYDGSVLLHTRYCYTVSALGSEGLESGETAESCATAGYVPGSAGTITDSATSLTWLTASPASPATYTWYGAVSYCSGLFTAGLSWRLPEVTEISSLIISPGSTVPYDAYVFDLTSAGGSLWSATPDPADYSRASYIDLTVGGLGSSAPKTYTFGLLCVSDPTPGSGFGDPVMVDSPYVGAYSSLKVDASGNSHISYLDLAGGSLKYATDASGAWATSVVDASGSVGHQTSLALDPTGRPHIAYHDAQPGGGGLKYAYMDGFGQWQKVAVDSTPGAGQYASLALDAAGAAHISYRAGTDSHLRYATNTGGMPPSGWALGDVDLSPDSGYHTSLALDSSGGVHISYIELTGMSLRYAYKAASAPWSLEAADASGAGYDYGTGLALDSAGHAHLSAYDLTNSRLKYAHRTATGLWTLQAADTVGGSGRYSSIAVDVQGGVHISSYYSTAGTLRYAYLPGGLLSWQNVTLDETAGMYTSLALGPEGRPRISYYDGYNSALKFLSMK